MIDAEGKQFYLRKESIAHVDPRRMGMEFWENDKSYRFLVRMKRYLAEPVADFGCGHGPLTILAARLGFSVTGFDCIGENVRNGVRLKQHGDSAEFVQSFLDCMPVPDNSFRSGMLKEVLEHILVPEIPSVLAEVRRVLAPGANLIVTAPRESLLSDNASPQHVTFFESPRRCALVLRKNGFEVVRKGYDRNYRRIYAVARVPVDT